VSNTRGHCSDSPGEGRAGLFGSCTPRHSGMHAGCEWQVAAVKVERGEWAFVGPCERNENRSLCRLSVGSACVPEPKDGRRSAKVAFLPRLAPNTPRLLKRGCSAGFDNRSDLRPSWFKISPSYASAGSHLVMISRLEALRLDLRSLQMDKDRRYHVDLNCCRLRLSNRLLQSSIDLQSQ
jgi:hypothetical protein